MTSLHIVGSIVVEEVRQLLGALKANMHHGLRRITFCATLPCTTSPNHLDDARENMLEVIKALVEERRDLFFKDVVVPSAIAEGCFGALDITVE